MKMAIASKEQERKALEKIRRIVMELSEDSYVGTAFEGAFELAEENIENDFALSCKNSLEFEQKKVENLNERLLKSQDENRELKKYIEILEGRVIDFQKRLSDTNQDYSSTLETAFKYEKMLKEQEERANALEQEVIVLKAKLYDLLCK